MKLVEIRDLEGPNLFAPGPTIKLELEIEPGEQIPASRIEELQERCDQRISAEPLGAIRVLIAHLHERIGLPPPEISVHDLDTPNHVAICYPWGWRTSAMAIAQVAFDLTLHGEIDDVLGDLERALSTDQETDDKPAWVRDSERRIPAAAVTGTNGKTTTTRFLAHIMRASGYRVGWSSSSGVYINGVQVIPGDYTGHGGARRVLTDPEVDCAVLENARGGILLRGLGYESNDVSVFLNVSADHLNLHGVTRLETLARVKATVLRVTRPDGVVVLNADDPLVLAQRKDVRAEVMLISQNPDNSAIIDHMNSGGRCLVVDSGAVTLLCGHERKVLIDVAQVPLTYGGVARHMVENSLAACAAAIGLGVDHQTIVDAMRTFHPDSSYNSGRLNVFDLEGSTFVIDFAHNESGLQHLIDFARQVFPEASRLTAIVGTAGDREDAVFVGLGRVAAERADRVLIKENPGYLRGRQPGDAIDLVREGVRQSAREERLDGAFSSEFEAAVAALDTIQPGEIAVIMCVEDYIRIVEELKQRGAQERTAAPA